MQYVLVNGTDSDLCKSQLEFLVKAQFWGQYFFQFISTMLNLYNNEFKLCYMLMT